jgi:hypothetical protein
MNDDDSYKQLITWGLRRQTTWAALILTFLTASLQTFFNIRLYNESYGIWSLTLTWLTVSLHILFSIGFFISIDRLFKLYNSINEWEKNIANKTIKTGISEATSWYHNFFTYRYSRIITFCFFLIIWVMFLFSKLIIEKLYDLG